MYVYFIIWFYFNLVIYLFIFHRHKEVREEKSFFFFLFFFVLRLTRQKDFTCYLDPNLAQCVWVYSYKI